MGGLRRGRGGRGPLGLLGGLLARAALLLLADAAVALPDPVVVESPLVVVPLVSPVAVLVASPEVEPLDVLPTLVLAEVEAPVVV